MRLVIEPDGTDPRGGSVVFVYQYGEQYDDLMRDPEIVFMSSNSDSFSSLLKPA